MATVLKGFKKGKGGKLAKTERGTVYTESMTAIVISNIPNESPYNVCLTTGLPKVGIDRLPPTNAVCVGLDPKQDDLSPYVWRVGIEYSTETDQQDTGEDPDPTTWVPFYKGKIQTVPEVLYKDFSDPPLPYLNSAFSKFPEPLVVNRPIIVYEFTQFEPAAITDEEIGDRNDTINSVDHRGFDAQTLHLSIPEFERGFFFGFPAVKIQYRVAYKKNKWLNRPIDAGYEFYTTDGVTWEKQKSDSLCLLNPNGTKRPERDEPLYLEFKQFLEIPFSFLR